MLVPPFVPGSGFAGPVSVVGPTAPRTLTLPDANTKVPLITQPLTFAGPTAPRTYTLPDADKTLAATTDIVTAHSGLSGLGADDHTQYALLAGRAGGQTLIGGTASGNNLLLQSNSNAIKGVIQLEGATSSFPALKVNGANLQGRLADDSAYCRLALDEIQVWGGSSTISVIKGNGGGFDFGNRGSSQTGSFNAIASFASAGTNESYQLSQYWTFNKFGANESTLFAAARSQLWRQTSGNAATNTVSIIGGVDHRSTGTPAAGFGATYEFKLQSSTTVGQAAADITSSWATATDASRKARQTFSVYDTAAREYLRGEASGSAPMIGFLGAAASAALASPDLGTLATTFGLASGTPTFAAANLTLTDVTTNNVSSTQHGLAPKSPADATQFLNGAATPAFAAVKDSDLSTSDVTTNNVATTKHGFVPKAPNDTSQVLKGDATWGYPSHTTAEAFVTATTSISAATYADITGASISLAAGTWLILGHASFSSVNAQAMLHLAIADGANAVISEGSQGVPASGSASVANCGNVALSAIVSPGSTTTYKLRGARGLTTLTGTVTVMDGAGTNTTNNLTDNTDKGTCIRAVRIG